MRTDGKTAAVRKIRGDSCCGSPEACSNIVFLYSRKGIVPVFYKNARIYTGDFQFHTGAFEVKDGRFGAVLPESVPADAVDLKGATVIPGLIEVHSHGNSNSDFCDGDYEGLKKMAGYYLSCGITSFAPASLTLPYDVLARAFATGRKLADERPEGCSVLRGINMEGPYFSEKKKGAQNGAYLKNPDFEGFKKLYDGCGGLIRIVDLAPELPGAVEFTEKASKLCTVSVAHTDSDYEHARAVFDAGATQMTHLYNAMSGIHHRNPGVIPAGSENPDVRAEIVCDGHHVHPSAVRLAFKMFKDRMIVISDSGRCAGLPEGTVFDEGGLTASVKGGVGRLPDGTISCSATNMWQCLLNCISWNIPEEEVIRACTYNPACSIGADKEVGSIETGKAADFLICTDHYAEKRVFLAGKEI